MSEYIENELNKRNFGHANGSSLEIGREKKDKDKDKDKEKEKETQITALSKTGMPSSQIKKRKADEISGKYFNLELHKIKSTSVIKNEDRVIKKAAQLESLPSSYTKNLPSIQNNTDDSNTLIMPHKSNKLSKIDENLLSSAAKNLPILNKMA